MAANEEPESTQGQAEVNVPNFDGSPEVPVGSASAQPFDQEALVAKIIAQLGPEIDRRFQSAKDKRLSALDKLGGVDDLLALKDYIKAKNGNVDEALRDFQIDQMLAQRSTSAPEAGRPVAPENPNAGLKEWTADILTEAGIAFDDPEYRSLASETVPDRSTFERKVTRFIARRAKQLIQPGLATVIVSGATGAPAGTLTKDDKLNRKYARLNELHQANPTLDVRKEIKSVSAEIVLLGGHA
jgi:hypothetical protein